MSAIMVPLLVFALLEAFFIPTVFAAGGVNPYASATLKNVYDGTGHSTPSQTFLNSKNKYYPGDNTPTDGVVSSGDRVQLKSIVDIRPGKERDVYVTYIIPEYLEYKSELNPNLNVNSDVISSSHPTVDGNRVVVKYNVKRGVPVYFDTVLNLVAKDTAGTVKDNQVVNVTVSSDYNSTYNTSKSRSYTVISAPAADIMVRPENYSKNSDGTPGYSGGPIEYNKTSANIEIYPRAISFQNYNNANGSSKMTEWSGKLDVSSLPKDTTFFKGSTQLKVVDGKIDLGKNSGAVTITAKNTNKWGLSIEGDSKSYPIHVILNDGSFSTPEFKNNGDGWQPGQNEKEDYKTAGARNTNASEGFFSPNNDWTRLKFHWPIVPDGEIFGKTLYRPMKEGNTWWDEGSKKFSVGEPQYVYSRNQYVDEGTEFRTHLHVYSQYIHTTSPHKVVISDQWNLNEQIPTGKLVVNGPNGVVSPNDYVVQWYVGNKSGIYDKTIVPDTVSKGWVTTNNPPENAVAVRIIFNKMPVDKAEGAGHFETVIPFVVNRDYSSYGSKLPAVFRDYMLGYLDGEVTNPVGGALVPVIRPIPTGTININTNKKVVDWNSPTVQYTVSPTVNNLATAKEPIKTTLDVTLDPCITNIKPYSPEWKLSGDVKYGNCVANTPGHAKFLVNDGNWIAKNYDTIKGESEVSPLTFDATVSRMALGDVSVAAKWTLDKYANQGRTYNSSVNVTAEPVNIKSSFIETTTEKVEVGDNLSFIGRVSYASNGIGKNTETVITLPNHDIKSPLPENWDGQNTSNFNGKYELANVKIDKENSVPSTRLKYFVNGKWQDAFNKTATKIKILQSSGGKQGTSVVKYDLKPINNKIDDEYVTWMSGVSSDGSVSAEPWPVVNKVVASTVSGYVYWDSSQTGKDRNPESQGIENVTLKLYKDGKELETTTTDKDGFYTFTRNFHSGDYIVKIDSGIPDTVESKFYDNKQLPVVQSFSYKYKKMSNSKKVSDTVNLGVDEVFENINFGFFAKDPHVDIQKKPARFKCDANGKCKVMWSIDIKNDGNTTQENTTLRDSIKGNVSSVYGTYSTPEKPFEMDKDANHNDNISYIANEGYYVLDKNKNLWKFSTEYGSKTKIVAKNVVKLSGSSYLEELIDNNGESHYLLRKINQDDYYQRLNKKDLNNFQFNNKYYILNGFLYKMNDGGKSNILLNNLQKGFKFKYLVGEDLVVDDNGNIWNIETENIEKLNVDLNLTIKDADSYRIYAIDKNGYLYWSDRDDTDNKFEKIVNSTDKQIKSFKVDRSILRFINAKNELWDCDLYTSSFYNPNTGYTKSLGFKNCELQMNDIVFYKISPLGSRLYSNTEGDIHYNSSGIEFPSFIGNNKCRFVDAKIKNWEKVKYIYKYDVNSLVGIDMNDRLTFLDSTELDPEYLAGKISKVKSFRNFNDFTIYSFVIDKRGNLLSLGLDKNDTLDMVPNGSKINRLSSRIKDFEVTDKYLIALSADGKLLGSGSMFSNFENYEKDKLFEIFNDAKIKSINKEQNKFFVVDENDNVYSISNFGVKAVRASDGTKIKQYFENAFLDESNNLHYKVDNQWKISKTEFKYIDSNGNSFYAIDKENNLWSWGKNYSGELGNGTINDIVKEPERVMYDTKFKYVAFNDIYGVGIDINDNPIFIGNTGDPINKTVTSCLDNNPILMDPVDGINLSSNKQTKTDDVITSEYNLGSIPAGKTISVSMVAEVNQSDIGQVVSNQAVVSTDSNPKGETNISPLPKFDSSDETKAGKLLGNTTCSANTQWNKYEKPGDQCDQVYAQVPKTKTIETNFGSVSGNVWLDTNKDGNKDQGENPVESMAVSLIDASGVEYATTVTDKNGYYHFPNVEKGKYQVSYSPGKGKAGTRNVSDMSWAWTPKINTEYAVDKVGPRTGNLSGAFDVPVNTDVKNINAAITEYAPQIDITKTYTDAEGKKWSDVTDKEVSNPDDQNVENPKSVTLPIDIAITNKGNEALKNITLNDETISGDFIATFKVNGTTFTTSQLPYTFSGVELAPGEKINITGDLVMKTPQVHKNKATTTGIGVLTGKKVTADSTFTATTIPEKLPNPSVSLTKRSNGESWVYTTSDKELPITFTIKNTGEEDLIDPQLIDKTTAGIQDVKNIKCDWGDTVVLKGITHNVIRKGATATCTGTLESYDSKKVKEKQNARRIMFRSGPGHDDRIHKNEARIIAVGIHSGKTVEDKDEFESRNEVVRHLVIHKLDGTTGKPVDGAQFLITGGDLPAEGKIVTGGNKWQIDLTDGEYEIVELNAPTGYQRIPNKISVSVSGIYRIGADSLDSLTNISHRTENGIDYIDLTINNYEQGKLPKTGTNELVLIIALAITILGAGYILRRRYDR